MLLSGPSPLTGLCAREEPCTCLRREVLFTHTVFLRSAHTKPGSGPVQVGSLAALTLACPCLSGYLDR